MKTIFIFALLLSIAYCDQWAVIVAGSNSFWNYRHQADACHAYQIHKAHGIPEDHIILFSYDDVVNDAWNPFPGHLYNQPGENPPDVYDGCKVTYSGENVTPENYMSVLTGDAAAITKRTGIENPVVLNSTEEDTVFLSFFDHGGPYVICFPDDDLTADNLYSTLYEMSDKHMFKKLVYYLEACESGSMFLELKTDLNIYAVTAAGPDESSWGYYCGEEAVVGNTTVGSCLGDLFSITWMEDTDLNEKYESLSDQWDNIVARVTLSEPHQFGTKSFLSDKIWEFMGKNPNPNQSLRRNNNKNSNEEYKPIDSRDSYYEFLKYKVSQNDKNQKLFISKLNEEEKLRRRVDNIFEELTNRLSNNKEEKSKLLNIKGNELKNREIYYDSIKAYKELCGSNEYSIKYYSTLLNLCIKEGSNKSIIKNLQDICKN